LWLSLLASRRKSTRRKWRAGKYSNLKKEIKILVFCDYAVTLAGDERKESAPESTGGCQKFERA
jgi:hypothetical protein